MTRTTSEPSSRLSSTLGGSEPQGSVCQRPRAGLRHRGGLWVKRGRADVAPVSGRRRTETVRERETESRAAMHSPPRISSCELRPMYVRASDCAACTRVASLVSTRFVKQRADMRVVVARDSYGGVFSPLLLRLALGARVWGKSASDVEREAGSIRPNPEHESRRDGARSSVEPLAPRPRE